MMEYVHTLLYISILDMYTKKGKEKGVDSNATSKIRYHINIGVIQVLMLKH